ncbi:hypothetical protein [Desertibacillus haloalkaliphilus]|uniref:hypothetical protein n=1 Tax=Desertibacillus haloalkaliphilus TaxID=1328930 RepID=UPI001C253843|nr:hypothetical protein [Desertibacillus haloalkaliphilus]MBU8906300.1 hypothetical protein [Desertibacillus haloalkaliphilus]
MDYENLQRLIAQAKQDERFFQRLSHDIIHTIQTLDYLNDETKRQLINSLLYEDQSEFDARRRCSVTCGDASCFITCGTRRTCRVTCRSSCGGNTCLGSCGGATAGLQMTPLEPQIPEVQAPFLRGNVQPGTLPIKPFRPGYPPQTYI